LGRWFSKSNTRFFGTVPDGGEIKRKMANLPFFRETSPDRRFNSGRFLSKGVRKMEKFPILDVLLTFLAIWVIFKIYE